MFQMCRSRFSLWRLYTEAGPETVEQAVGARQSLQSQVAAAMARLMGGKK